MSNRLAAKITGWSLIIMAAIAAFAFGYAWPIFNTEADLMASALKDNYPLYTYMLVGILLIILLDFIVSWTLYVFFKQVGKTRAMNAFLLRIAYTLVFAYATFVLTKNLGNVDASSIELNYQSFNQLWSSGLIVFGFHIVLIGLLMRSYAGIHKLIWALTLIAGFSYIAVHALKVLSPQLEDFTSTLEMILALPMALGELVLAVWLIVRGGKE